MNHPTETQLNEYLDGALSAAQRRRVEAHLTGCATCRAELESLQGVFTALTALADEAPARDLAPAFQAAPRLKLGWRMLLAAQAGLGLGVLILFGRYVAGLLRPHLDLRPAMAAGVQLTGQLALQLHKLELRSPVIKSSLPVWTTFALLALVLVLFALGNTRLLRNGKSVNQ